jgi:hypothetical protein
VRHLLVTAHENFVQQGQKVVERIPFVEVQGVVVSQHALDLSLDTRPPLVSELHGSLLVFVTVFFEGLHWAVI